MHNNSLFIIILILLWGLWIGCVIWKMLGTRKIIGFFIACVIRLLQWVFWKVEDQCYGLNCKTLDEYNKLKQYEFWYAHSDARIINCPVDLIDKAR